MSGPDLSLADLAALFGHFVVLSLLAVGGAITTAADMHRYLVNEHGWLTDAQFNASIALAQAAPGPNVLFVAVLGYNTAGLAGAALTMLGMLLPSTTLALWASRWGRAHRETHSLRAFTAGMAPLTLGLLLATGWLLTEPSRERPGALLLVALSTLVMARTRWSPIWLVALGAGVGALGYA